MLLASAGPDVVHWPQISYINQTRRAAGRDVTAPLALVQSLTKAVLPCVLCQFATKHIDELKIEIP
jgi:hypothetical protein